MHQIKAKYKKFLTFYFIIGLFFSGVIFLPNAVLAQGVSTAAVILQNRFAPGEFLPISAKLLNFGAGERVDVSIDYKITDSYGNEILKSSETVAVETTASFVKLLQLPPSIKPGWYEASALILYAGQKFPATSSFGFNVEKKYAGFFMSQWLIYGSIIILISLAVLFIARLILKKQKRDRFNPHDYKNVPKDDRIFYEVLSDIVVQMRLRVGDKALELAGGIEGLVIDEENGRIIKVSQNPAKIIALLVLRYENELGEKISFGLRQTESTLGTDDEVKEKINPVDNNLAIVGEYFK